MRIYANLKCNHTRKSFENYAKNLDKFCKNSNLEVKVFAPASAFMENKFSFKIGAQNFYPCENGNFTGEIGFEMLKEFDINSILIGHSERRILGEDNDLLKAKFEFAKDKSLNIVFCVGENLEIKNSGKTKEFLAAQLQGVDLSYENLIIAYEPVWAIGTGKSANLGDIDEILDFLRTLTKAPLLYGGSVNESNINEILKIKNCGGALVGSASYEVDGFINLLKDIK
ncbi:triose-phosphate isomerase [Campylobacter sp. FMV-PI01]|uniref:Triosephosphate isomerase n=1 Tax=Campylobacter portucalensis TaxID=2608384 RepID=A0A6L5WFB1_9BACT|nr:triose-phosphate isomerase [Campylobacter portucalensis]MSN95614.1 triose-phosphate isomerase [Campylobacter portucalensis]